MKNPEYFTHAINALAEVKSNLIGNKFDVTKLEVSDCDGENLSTSVHQDWELSASKKERTVAGQEKTNVRCENQSTYKQAVMRHMNDINGDLPISLLNEFKTKPAFYKADDFTIDNTSIGYVDQCSPCNGSGKVRCGSCNGKGSISVHVRDNVTTRRDSNGREQEINRTPVYENRTCGSCGGSGRVICSPCAGSGYITKITDIIRTAVLHLNYSIEQGNYSEVSINEIMNLSLPDLNLFAHWHIGQSTAQENHFQIQYITQLDIVSFGTMIKDKFFNFMSFVNQVSESPYIFNKSPIMDVILYEPLQICSQIKRKTNQEASLKFLELFKDYQILQNIMQTLAQNPNYSKQNVNLVVNNEVMGYLSVDMQKNLVTAIIKSFKSCLPLYSKNAVVFSNIWLMFTPLYLFIPFLPLERKSGFTDGFYLQLICFTICVAASTLFSRLAVKRKYRKLPDGITTPKQNHFKPSLITAVIFAMIGFITANYQNQAYIEYLGFKDLYPHQSEQKSTSESNIKSITSKPVPQKSSKNNPKVQK